MDPIRNPFTPGTGSKPPELAGREKILEDASTAIRRALIGKQTRSQILLGLRGVGKTVLLNAIEEIASNEGHITSVIGAPQGRALSELLIPRIHQVLRKLSMVENAKESAHKALRALRSLASIFTVSYGDASIAVEPEAGVADSGDLEADLSELFIRVGEAAKIAGKAWTLLIDEVQYIHQEDLAALIVAIHKVNQKGLPILFFGAGLPQVAALSGDAKSYAERLFLYPGVGPLEDEDAMKAITQPVKDEGEEIEMAAVRDIIEKTKGYPYFLQEWGYHCWNLASGPRIQLEDARRAAAEATRRLDEGFFKVRFDRLTPKEREYVIAMARLGAGPYRTSDVADLLNETNQSLGPRRAQIIRKGMIFSPSHGDIAFTAPMFDEYLMRNFGGGAATE